MREVVPMQKAFQQGGYVTAAFGKRHLSEACDDGWSITASHSWAENLDDNYVKWINEQGYAAEFAQDWAAEFGGTPRGSVLGQQEIPFALMATRQSALPDDMTMEAFTKQRTISFLEDRAKDEQPFFCWASFYRPHQPYTPLKRYWDRHDRSRWGEGTNAGDAISMPKNLHQEVSELPPMLQSQFAGKNRVWRLDKAREDEQLYRDYVSAYCALVEEIDACIGDVLYQLEQLGLAENTIVVYSADHGDFVGAHGMVEKCAQGHNVFEDTLRVPLLFKWPGHIESNVVRQDLAELVDIYPTLLEFCDVAQPSSKHPLQGQSLVGTLAENESVKRDFTVSENWSQSTIITDRYKLGAWQEPADGKHPDFRDFGNMLFDLENDPDEIVNIYEESEDIRVQLEVQLSEWQQRYSE
jgi:arylsulfatase A-like enzyme